MQGRVTRARVMGTNLYWGVLLVVVVPYRLKEE